jgi:hypothetical protein
MVMITPGNSKRKHCMKKFSSRVKCLLMAECRALHRPSRDAQCASAGQGILNTDCVGDDRGRDQG